MQRFHRGIPLVLLACMASLPACEDAQVAESQVLAVETIEDLPRCNPSRTGVVYYVSSADQFFFCDGRAFVPVDLSGQDGTSCTVSRDDAAGTTTIRCEDGTEAVVYDGADGEDGQDGTSCSVAETAEGATITCGTDMVTITDGQDGSSCSVSTDASGAVTISCDDGTSATIPAGDGAGVSIELLCELIVLNELEAPLGLDCTPACPCFSQAEVESSAVTGCRNYLYPYFEAGGWQDIVDTVPLTQDLAGSEIQDPPVGDFGVYGLNQPDAFYLGFRAQGPYGCFRPGVALDGIPEVSYDACRAIVEEVGGVCEPVVFCAGDAPCDDFNDCTEDSCTSEGVCSNSDKPTGTSCEIRGQSAPGQCFRGNCLPVLSP